MSKARTSKIAFHAVFTLRHKIVAVLSSPTPNGQGAEPMTTSGNIRITLTQEQKDQVRKATGKEAEAVELSVEELEERIAPMVSRGRPVGL
jgi:hypothetical protein